MAAPEQRAQQARSIAEMFIVSEQPEVNEAAMRVFSSLSKERQADVKAELDKLKLVARTEDQLRRHAAATAKVDDAIRLKQATSAVKIGEAESKQRMSQRQAQRIGKTHVAAYKMVMQGPHGEVDKDPALTGLKKAILGSDSPTEQARVYILEKQAGANYQQRMATAMADLTQKAQAAGIADVSSLGIPEIAKRAVEGDPGVVADFGKAVNEAKRMNAIRSAGEQLEAAKVVRPELLKKFTDQLAAKATTEAEVGALSGGIKAALMGEEAALARTGKLKKAGLGGAAALLAIPILKSIFSKNEPEKMSPQMQMMLAQQLSQGTAGGEGSLETGRTLNNMTKLLALIKTVQGMSGMMGDQQAPLSRLV